MSKDEARKLLGGYATGSLTEAERKELFQAALNDQELFDELAGEQVLKEVLDEPGARQRLLAALKSGPHRSGWWMRPWPWAAAAASVAIAILLIVSNRTVSIQPLPPIHEELTASAPPVPPPAARKVSPPTPSAEAPAELKKEEALADQLQKVQPQAAAEAARGFVAGGAAPAATRRAQNETVTVTTATGTYFSYVVRADGSLEIVILERGFLSVTASLMKSEVAIFPSASVAPPTTIRLQVPSDAIGLVIGFSKTPGTNDAPIEQVAAEGFGIDLRPSYGKIRIQPTPLFLKLETR